MRSPSKQRGLGKPGRKRGPRQEEEEEESCQWFTLKMVGMVSLIALDLGLNSSLEYDLYANYADLALIMFG